MRFNKKMMKKILIAIILYSNITYSYISAYSTTREKVISSTNENAIRPIASLTKVMNVIVALDIIKENKINLDEYVTIDYKMTKIRETGIDINVGDKVKLSDLLKAQLVYSANNAAYATAYYLGGNLENYVSRMNNKALELEMNKTKFYTPAGLPTSYTKMPLDVSTAKDLSIMAFEATKYNEIMEWAKLEYVSINGKKYHNRNKILGEEGNYGLKTGYHSLSGYNMIGLSKVNGVDLVTVTLADESNDEKFSSQLFLVSQFKDKFKRLISKNQVYGNISVKNSKEKYIEAVLTDNFDYYDKDLIIDEKIYNLEGNINIGDKVGEIDIYTSKKEHIKSIDIIAKTSSKKLNFFEKLLSLWYNN